MSGKIISGNKKIAYLEALRGIASIMVMLNHLLSNMYYPYPWATPREEIFSAYPIQYAIYRTPLAILSSGTAAVYIFFIMSGIVLSLMVDKRNVSLISNTLSRYIRLAIPAAVSCLLGWEALRIMLIYFPNQPHNGLTNTFLEIANPGLLDALYQGFIYTFFGLGTAGNVPYNLPLWTITIEFFGSVALFIACKTKKPLCTMLLLTLPFLFSTTQNFLGIFAFFIGMLIKEQYLLVKKSNDTGNNKTHLRCWFFLLAGLYFAGINSTNTSYLFFLELLQGYTFHGLKFLAGVCIVLAIVQSVSMQRFLQHSLLIKVGKLSFPLYFTHWIVFYVFCVIFAHYQLSPALSALILVPLSLLIAIPFIALDNLAIKLAAKIKR